MITKKGREERKKSNESKEIQKDSTRKEDRKRCEIDFCCASIICYLINCPLY
jgi:hypothetical protein